MFRVFLTEFGVYFKLLVKKIQGLVFSWGFVVSKSVWILVLGQCLVVKEFGVVWARICFFIKRIYVWLFYYCRNLGFGAFGLRFFERIRARIFERRFWIRFLDRVCFCRRFWSLIFCQILVFLLREFRVLFIDEAQGF